ncbi:MAG TPA: LysR family transcriptional regulator, partial [Bdellovibrio sp.]|nr:LysR family transcriptional regulator [Bdellovibrio sp.]
MPKIYSFDTFKYVDIIQREIIYFMCLAEVLNISRASEILGIQQSGLSRALQRLESDLGQKLFQRKNNGLALTQAGQQFFLAVKSTKNSWEENFKKIVTDSETPTGLIKIGFHSSFGQRYFPKIANAISKNFPQVEIEAHILSSALITRKVNEQDIDFGLVISNIKNPDLVQKKVGFDFLAAFQKNINKTPDKMLFNPEMQASIPIMRKHSGTKKIIIKDYDIMAQTA